MATKPIPYGLHTVTPYVMVENAQALLNFVWWIATHIEDVPPDELARRAKAQIEQRK